MTNNFASTTRAIPKKPFILYIRASLYMRLKGDLLPGYHGQRPDLKRWPNNALVPNGYGHCNNCATIFGTIKEVLRSDRYQIGIGGVGSRLTIAMAYCAASGSGGAIAKVPGILNIGAGGHRGKKGNGVVGFHWAIMADPQAANQLGYWRWRWRRRW